jgi:hypothetical protein
MLIAFPIELEINDNPDPARSASYIDLHIKFDSD